MDVTLRSEELCRPYSSAEWLLRGIRCAELNVELSDRFAARGPTSVRSEVELDCSRSHLQSAGRQADRLGPCRHLLRVRVVTKTGSQTKLAREVACRPDCHGGAASALSRRCWRRS